MSELIKKPETMKKAQQEVCSVLGQSRRGVITNTDLVGLSYLQMVIKEVLRLHPPNPLLVPRESREDCEVMHGLSHSQRHQGARERVCDLQGCQVLERP